MKKRDYALKKSLLTKTNTDLLILKGLRNAVVVVETAHPSGSTSTVLLKLSQANKKH